MAPASAALVWFRRDLRAHDHAALHSALAAAHRQARARTLARYGKVRSG
jgi:deoxyribodipyrimidine photolyase